MGSPFQSALAKLDDSVQNLEYQLSCLRGGLDVGDDQLWQALNEAHQSAASLREMVRSERPDADWSDRAALELLIQHLECDAQARRDEQRRAKLFELANELDAGAIKHRFESRVSALNSLRLQAIRELRIAATLFEQEKELPGPQASEWLAWACNLREESDASVFGDLRRDFPALERFASEMEESYWVSSPREQKPVTQPSGVPANLAMPAPRPRDLPTTVAPVDMAPRNTRFQPEPKLQADSQAASAPSYQPPSNGRDPVTDHSSLGTAEAAVATTTRESYRALDKFSEHSNGNRAVGELNASSTVKMWTVPAHPPAATPVADETSGEAVEDATPDQSADNLLPSFGAAVSTKRPIAAWVAAGTILALCLVFAGTYYFSSASGKPNGGVAHAAANPAGAPDSGTQTQSSGVPAGAGQAANGPGLAPASPAALIQPVEGAQHQILLDMESCRRSNPDGIDCQGYVTNLSNAPSHVTLDGVDVVDGRGNSFNLNSSGQFNFSTGRSLSLAAGSRAKYTVKVPDKDREARTLTVYVDVNNPHGLEYTFRNVPISE